MKRDMRSGEVLSDWLRTVDGHFGYKSYLKNDGSGVWPVPVGLLVNWDVEEEEEEFVHGNGGTG